MLVVIVWARSLSRPAPAVALGFVLGGGAGNLVDRVMRSTPGVVDWIDVGAWPVFNLADAAIVTGVTMLVLLPARVGGLREGRESSTHG